MLHEIGHALDHIDQMSAGAEFTALHALVRPVLADTVYRDRPAELFAEGFALAAAHYPAGLVTMMNGHEARAEVLSTCFGQHYLIGRRTLRIVELPRQAAAHPGGGRRRGLGRRRHRDHRCR